MKDKFGTEIKEGDWVAYKNRYFGPCVKVYFHMSDGERYLRTSFQFEPKIGSYVDEKEFSPNVEAEKDMIKLPDDEELRNQKIMLLKLERSW